MRQRLFIFASAGIGLVAAAIAIDGCGSDAAGICDFGECTAQQISSPDGSVENDATTGQEGSVNGDGGEEASASCGPDAALTYCGNTAGCVDTTTSLENCGTCGNVCAVPANGSATCSGGMCGIICSEGTGQCNGGCVPNTNEPAQNPCAISNANGIFVAPSGSDSAAGTETAPVASIAQGVTLAKAMGLVVFVCDATYQAPLAFGAAQDGVAVYGGLVCPGTGVTNAWAYEGAKATVAPVTPTPGATALAITGLTTGMTFEDFVFQSANASGVDSDGNGSSSIAVTVSGSTGMVFKRVNMVAGTGAAGNAGATLDEDADAGAQAGTGGSPPMGALSEPGLGCQFACPNGVSTAGGTGGAGAAVTPGSGIDGTPDVGADAGRGGAGQTATNGGCVDGTAGAGGDAGAPGQGSQTLGALSVSGWSPGGQGASGAAGATAQGGGGGGGARYVGMPTGGGGGGGCGGCGGDFGTGGAAGGASVALASINSSVTLDGCTLSAASGGNGGAGGDGETGQVGGDKGPAAGNGCPGGPGGNGGAGGGGGGGAGGSSFDIAYTGTAPTQSATTLSTSGGGGPGGQPGANGATSGGTGIAGAAATSQGF